MKHTDGMQLKGAVNVTQMDDVTINLAIYIQRQFYMGYLYAIKMI